MTSETKVGLLVGTAIILLIGILVSDHFMVLRDQNPADLTELANETQRGIGSTDSAARSADTRNNYSSHTQTVPTTRPEIIAPVPLPEELIRDQERTALNQHSLAAAAIAAQPTTTNPTTTAFPTLTQNTGTTNDPSLVQRLAGDPSRTVQPTLTLTPGTTTAPAVRTPEPAIHYVKDRETLWSIAEKYYGDGSYWKKIQQVNADSVHANGAVREGVRLVLPHKAALDSGTTQTAAALINTGANTGMAMTQQAPAVNVAPNTAMIVAGQQVPSRTVTVASGETLTKIATKHLGSAARWPELLDANRDQISRPEDLKAGMTLRLPATPTAGSNTSTAVITQPSRREPVQNPTTTSYAVQRGDTLSSIARKTLGSDRYWETIYQANRRTLNSPDNLVAGQTLVIPSVPRG